MIRRPPRSTQSRSSAASDVYKRQFLDCGDKPFHVFQEGDVVAEDRGVDVSHRETDDVGPGRTEECCDVARWVFAEGKVQDGDRVTCSLERRNQVLKPYRDDRRAKITVGVDQCYVPVSYTHLTLPTI